MLKNFCKDNRRKKLVRTPKTRERLRIICETLKKVIKSLCKWQRDFCFWGANAMNKFNRLTVAEMQSAKVDATIYDEPYEVD